MHFNHSIVETATGKNMFYDPERPDNLSDFIRHWIGGLIHHANALTALCCATVNCYRRIGADWAPAKANWGLDNRHAMLRVKTSTESATYIENRMPGGGANPYVVMAATIAAGLDGVEKEIECPPAVSLEECKAVLPNTMEDGLKALQEDKVICEALGEKFVLFFCHERKHSQMTKFPDWKWENKDDEQFLKERDYYLKCV